MKNFRKVLALVLVVATLFSFTAMAGAAYEDQAKISSDYEMAVDVLSAVGILNGYEVKEDTYEFHPESTITREEMAKMIAVLANAGYDVSDLYANASKFADVPSERWSASYVAYCASTGIVAGRSAKTFDPTGKVTGLETAKMLLVTLGFNAEHQGYVGADWKVNVLRDAKIMGLTENFASNYNIDAAITRQEAAQMMLNALRAPAVVGFLSNNQVTITNALTFKDLTATITGTTTKKDAEGNVIVDKDSVKELTTSVKVVNYATLMDALKTGKWALYGNVIISDDVLHTQLFPGLKFNDSMPNCQHRAGYGFTYTKNGVVVASGTYNGAAGKQYTTRLDLAADYSKELAAKSGSKYLYDVAVYIDGVNAVNFKATEADHKEAAALVKDLTGNGADTLVTIHGHGDGTYTIEVNILYTYVGEVANYDDYKNTFDIVDAKGDVYVEGVSVDAATKNGDMILFTLCDASKGHGTGEISGKWAGNGSNAQTKNAVHSYEVVTPTTITVDYSRHYTDKTQHDTCYLKTTEGKEYKYNYNFNNLYEEAVEAKQGQKKSIYLDKYGYIMLITDPAAEAAKVAYFEENSAIWVDTEAHMVNGLWTKDHIARIDAYHYANKDGAVEAEKVDTNIFHEYTLKDLGNLKETLTRNLDLFEYYQWRNFMRVGTLASYSKDADGMAVLDQRGEFVIPYQTIGKDTVNIITQDNNKLAMTSKTTFIIRTKDARTGEWSYEEVVGRQNLKDEYLVELFFDPNDKIPGTDVELPAFFMSTTAQALDLDDDHYADYVFVDARLVKKASEFLVLQDGKQYEASWTGVAGLTEDYDVYRALVNGVDSIVAVDPHYVGFRLAPGLLYTTTLEYKDVVLVEDQSMPLYVAAAPSFDFIQPMALDNLAVKVVADGEVYVNIDNDLSFKALKAIDNLPVYHMVQKEDANDMNGYWIEYNKVNPALAESACYGYMLKNDDGVVTAIYLIQGDMLKLPVGGGYPRHEMNDAQ